VRYYHASDIGGAFLCGYPVNDGRRFRREAAAMQDPNGKVAVIIGAAGGIGLASARALGREGMKAVSWQT
jgi:hypothetical protein